jgi:4-diphosphocytidyl-2-C-methyl-D-erythritol kinase
MVEAAAHRDTCSPSLTVSAPAKLNLLLRIHGRRADGYHALTSLVVGVELFDELTFTRTPQPGVHLTCDDPTLPVDDDNLVVRAAARLAARVRRPEGVRIALTKRIPVAAGLGGGSSDCAATLQALNRLWGAGWAADELQELGAELGSDVPLFFHLPAAVITGRGECVRSVRPAWSGWVVLACGGWAVSTPAVYAQWQATDGARTAEGAVDAMLSCRTAAELSRHLCNELEPAVFRAVPAVRGLVEGLAEATGMPWRISGAGSTAFALFDQEVDARHVADVLRATARAPRLVVVRMIPE